MEKRCPKCGAGVSAWKGVLAKSATCAHCGAELRSTYLSQLLMGGVGMAGGALAAYFAAQFWGRPWHIAAAAAAFAVCYLAAGPWLIRFRAVEIDAPRLTPHS